MARQHLKHGRRFPGQQKTPQEVLFSRGLTDLSTSRKEFREPIQELMLFLFCCFLLCGHVVFPPFEYFPDFATLESKSEIMPISGAEPDRATRYSALLTYLSTKIFAPAGRKVEAS
jgi:hypothetical protein